MASSKAAVKLFHHYPFKIPRLCLSTKSKNADQSEVDTFSKLSEEWWDPNSQAKPLLSMNDLRVPFVRDGLVNSQAITNKKAATAKPLEGIRVLDVGCGGGYFSMPLARLGADVTGLDPSVELVRIATEYARKNLPNKDIEFISGTIEDHAAIRQEHYDVVVCSEVIEHVTAKDSFINACVAAVKPRGSLFFTTISQTTTAWLVAIIAGEHIFRFIPKGSHQYDKLITPQQLSRFLEKEGCRVSTVNGMVYNPITNRWSWRPNTAVTYALHALKDA